MIGQQTLKLRGVKRSPYSLWGIVKPQKGEEKSCCLGCKEKRPLGIQLEMSGQKHVVG